MTKTIAQLIDDYSQGITARQDAKQARRDKFANQVTTILSDTIGRTLQRGEDELLLSQDVTRKLPSNQSDYTLEALYNDAHNQDNVTLIVCNGKRIIFELTDLFISLGYIYVHKVYLAKTQVNRKTIRYELEMRIDYHD